MYSANVTVPDDTTLMSVPDAHAISNPVCLELLIELDTPYLEDILPLTGSTDNFTPLITASASFSSFIS